MNLVVGTGEVIWTYILHSQRVVSLPDVKPSGSGYNRGILTRVR